jgi:poly(A) polymerase
VPILTPAYPAMNSTYNVSKSTLRILQEELKRGQVLTEQLRRKPASESSTVWKELLEPVDFFFKHKHYLHLIITASNEADLLKWYGWCESRIRQLVAKLAMLQGVKVYPYPESYPCTTPERPHAEGFFIGLEFERKVSYDDQHYYHHYYNHNHHFEYHFYHFCCYCYICGIMMIILNVKTPHTIDLTFNMILMIYAALP